MFGNILTGGIGCGKSTVANILRLEGFHIIDADKVNHLILEKNANIIRESFGNEIMKNGIIDRKKLGEIIFNNSTKRKLLESILHPLIREEILNQSQRLESSKKPYFIEIPLYFESEFKYPARFVVCVYANKSLQIKRVMERNNFTEQQALSRINSQIDIEIKREKSDFIIDNSGDLKILQNNIDLFLESFLKHFE